VAVQHVGALKYLKCILLLGEEEALGGAVDVDAKEVVDVTKITHGELGVEGVDDGVEEGGGVGGENNVINI
jgi:hypothetical protein